MDSETREDLIYDWNNVAEPSRKAPVFELVDETLRDGLQSPSATDPPLEEKIHLLHLMDQLGIQHADIGLPGAGGKMSEDVFLLAKEIERSGLKIRANCAARTVIDDIRPVVELNQKCGIGVDVAMFIGSSSIRRYAENWTLDMMMKSSEQALAFAAENNLSVMYVTEDTTRAHPETLEKLYGLAIDMGAKYLVLCDTVGHAMPSGVRKLIHFVQDLVKKKGKPVKIDWHGHMDRGMGVINSLTAIQAGADRVHATAAGIGERAGNTPMDTMLVNLRLMGWYDHDLSKLGDYVTSATKSLQIDIPISYPVFGSDAFETATGVHASAVYKALKKGDTWLANRVYSGVPADDFGMSQHITIGPMSGKSNVLYWCEQNGVESKPDVVDKILSAAKKSRAVMTDDDIRAALI